MNVRVFTAFALSAFLAPAALGDGLNLGNVSNYQGNCEPDAGAFRSVLQGTGTEVVFEAPHGQHIITFLICNETGANNIRMVIDSGNEFGKIDNNSCALASAKNRIELRNMHDKEQRACIKPVMVRRVR